MRERSSQVLFEAAKNGDVAAIEAALAEGADIDRYDKALGRTALIQATAAQLGHAGMVALLLEAGADPALLDHRGENAFSLARAQGRDAILPLLAQAGGGPPPPKPEVMSLPWPKLEAGAERASPETVVRAYILAMADWEARAHARRLDAARDPAVWAEQKDIVARFCTAKPRVYPFASYGSPSKHAAEDGLLSVTPEGAKAEVIVLHFNGVDDWEHRFAIHRKAGEWRIDNLKSRMRGTQRWERDIV